MNKLSVHERMTEVLARVRARAERSGRPAEAVRVVLVTKGVPAATVRQAAWLEGALVGESRVVEAIEKQEALADCDFEWHFIGHLQRNKVGRCGSRFKLIHSVDSLELLASIDRCARSSNGVQDVLLQVNVAREVTKSGFMLDQVATALKTCQGWSGVRVRGLMTIPPRVDDPEEVRPVFRRLREFATQDLQDVTDWPGGLELSMGMSTDFEVAIEEGATLVRIGRAIFGERPTGAGSHIQEGP
ncbi:MAG: YggS family pyridoxal phosphate-dependent enzyme [bacterium]|nr:YggS family pyridoxal phosphate-dependent enzyme [bacterium]